MNITSQYTPLPLATVVNPPTDSLRRDNNLREVIIPPEAASQSAAEKGVSGDKDKARTPAQHNQQADAVSIRKQAVQEQTTINGNSQHSSGDPSGNTKEEQNKKSQKQAAKQDQQVRKQQLEKQQIAKLQQRDQEVKAHEAAHASVGGANTGAPSFTYKKGPNGVNYAVSGEVSVDVSTVAHDPKATIAKMQQVRAAALAPVDPSGQDKSVAAQASRTIAAAQAELLKNKNSLNKPVNTTANINDTANNEHSVTTSTSSNNTLKAQGEPTTVTRSAAINQRAQRIENFYLKITQANQKSVNFQIQLTA